MTESRTRAEMTQAILLLDAVGEVAAERAKELRAQLTKDAEDEYATEGAAPTWRTPAGTISMRLTHTHVIVDSDSQLLAWVVEHHPGNVMQTIRPAFRAALLDGIKEGQGQYPDPRSGELMDVPGVHLVSGGVAAGISLRKNAQAKAEALDVVRGRVDALTAGVTEPELDDHFEAGTPAAVTP